MDRTHVNALLTSMLSSQERVSDLIFMAGGPPLVESDGILSPFPIDTPDSCLASDFIDQLADEITNKNERLRADYQSNGSCDCSYELENVARLRANIYKERGRRAIVLRKLEPSVPTLDQLQLPPIFREIAREKNGIILVTGAAGSGKTTTLAALINELNQTQHIHIVTLEDPIEYIHQRARAAISHRELGRDFFSFDKGLRAALRQAPKAILVGEIRDRETMEIAVTAAETGHLVLSTLHTINAGQTINRILGFFSKDEEEQMRYRLSDTVRYIVSQRLVPKISAGRLLISEVLGTSLRTRESIRYGESEGKTFHEIIDAAGIYGWHSFDQCLLKGLEENEISEETALLSCNDRGRMRRELDLFKKRHGQVDPELSTALKLEISMPPKTMTESVEQSANAPADAAGDLPGSNRRIIKPRAAATSE
jgi:twitching motility protein PilT